MSTRGSFNDGESKNEGVQTAVEVLKDVTSASSTSSTTGSGSFLTFLCPLLKFLGVRMNSSPKFNSLKDQFVLHIFLAILSKSCEDYFWPILFYFIFGLAHAMFFTDSLKKFPIRIIILTIRSFKLVILKP